MTKPQNYHTIRYGNKDGELKFGHITDNGEIDAFIVRSGADPNHYIEMCSGGGPNRKNGTVCRSTGTFNVKAGDRVKSTKNPENNAIVFEAVDGDILLSAPNGRVKIDAQNIDLVGLRGFDGKNGTITLSANEKIILESGGEIHINGAVSTKIASNDTVNIVGNAILNVYAGLIDFADGASTTLAAGPKFGSKGGPHENEVRNSK